MTARRRRSIGPRRGGTCLPTKPRRERVPLAASQDLVADVGPEETYAVGGPARLVINNPPAGNRICHELCGVWANEASVCVGDPPPRPLPPGGEPSLLSHGGAGGWGGGDETSRLGEEPGFQVGSRLHNMPAPALFWRDPMAPLREGQFVATFNADGDLLVGKVHATEGTGKDQECELLWYKADAPHTYLGFPLYRFEEEDEPWIESADSLEPVAMGTHGPRMTLLTPERQLRQKFGRPAGPGPAPRPPAGPVKSGSEPPSRSRAPPAEAEGCAAPAGGPRLAKRKTAGRDMPMPPSKAKVVRDAGAGTPREPEGATPRPRHRPPQHRRLRKPRGDRGPHCGRSCPPFATALSSNRFSNRQCPLWRPLLKPPFGLLPSLTSERPTN